jgi:hypothetical protein
MPHSFLPPSGAAAWSQCAQWPTMNKLYPQDDTAESIEGTAAHWVCSELLRGRTYPVGHIAPNSVAVTEEMLDGADLYRDSLETRLFFKAPPGYTSVEEIVYIPSIHADCFGTPDAWEYFPGDAHLEIVDYKYGHGFIDEYFNKQGLLYALGAIEALLKAGIMLPDPEKISVSFTVVQPRCYYRGAPVRTHSYTVAEAAQYIRQIEAAALAATTPNPTATTNPECGHCPGRHACSALQRAAYNDAEYADERQPHNLSPQAAALELRMLERSYERLGARVDGLKELTLANIKNGASIPYYRVEAGKGRRNWTASAEQIIAIGIVLGKDLSKPGVITPAQAEKLGLDEAVSNSYSQITPGSLKLIQQNNADARRVFSEPGE